MTQAFTVYGDPQGKGRPRFGRSVYGNVNIRTPDKTIAYENLIKTEYRIQCGAHRFNDNTALTMTVKAYYSIPKSTGKKKRSEMITGDIRPTKKPDADNVLKIVADSLNGIAYRDDAQLVCVVLDKYYGERPRLEVVICEG